METVRGKYVNELLRERQIFVVVQVDGKIEEYEMGCINDGNSWDCGFANTRN